MDESVQIGPLRIPRLVSEQGSLPPFEKSLLAHFVALLQPAVFVELGVYHAVTTDFVCSLLEENGWPGRVVGFDLDDVVAGLRAGNPAVRRWESAGRLELVPGWLPTSLRAWLSGGGEQIDLALIDGTHDYRSVLSELELLWPRMAPDGMILLDDYSEIYDGVRYAVHRFVGRHNDAMALPLGSARTRGTPYGSAMAGVCRSPIAGSLRGSAPHMIAKAKADALEHPALNRIWRAVRPLVRRR